MHFQKITSTFFFNPYWYNKFLTPVYVESDVTLYANNYSTKKIEVMYSVNKCEYVENITASFNILYKDIRGKDTSDQAIAKMMILGRETYKDGIKTLNDSSLNIGNGEIIVEITAPAEIIPSFIQSYKVQNHSPLSTAYSWAVALPGTAGTGSASFNKGVTKTAHSEFQTTSDSEGKHGKKVRVQYSNRDFLQTTSDNFGLIAKVQSEWRDPSYNHDANKGLYATFVYYVIPNGATNATFAPRETVFRGCTYKTNLD